MASSFDSTLASLGITRTTTAANPAANASGSSTLGQGDFLKLMTAQMNNQDPFDPVDNTQMVAQMAQFSQLSGITEMSTTLKAMSDKLGATSATDAMSYIGKTVLTEGSTAYGRAGGGIAGGVELDATATDVAVTITAADGLIVKSMNLGPRAPGTTAFDWDGKTQTGEDAGSGPFTVTALAQNAGKSVPSRTLVWAPVQSVSMPTTGPAQLTLPGIGTVATTAIRQIG